MNTTDQIIQDILSDVSVKIPDLIEQLNINAEGKNTEIGDILEIAKNLKKAMESFSSSVDQIKNLSEFIEVAKETNIRLEEIRKEIQNMISIVMGLNDKINKTQEKINVKNPQRVELESLGEKKSEIKKKSNFSTIIVILSSSVLTSVFVILGMKYLI